MYKKFELIKNMGLGWTTYRSLYELKKKTGLLERKYPCVSLNDKQFGSKLKLDASGKDNFVYWWKQNTASFFLGINENNKDTIRELLKNDCDSVLLEADKICNYTFTYFNKWKVKYKELDWHYNPITKLHSPKDKHWLKIPDLGGDFGDIKYIWELSRFSFVFTLVRAYSITSNEKYVKVFWDIVEDWIKENPNQLGVNYKCCQEMSIRMMAWIFGLYAFKDHNLSTDGKIFELFKAIYLHADHIEKHFEFSLRAVKNNHTITEAVAIYTVGVLFPFFDKSKKWKKKGLKHLQQEAFKQIYEDGGYIQHSMNYHRLMLQDYTWAIQLGKLNGEVFSEVFLDKIQKATLFLYTHQEESSGRLPNYGMNDGSIIHPLSQCDYLDYRPQINAIYHVLTGHRLYNDGIHDENLFWISGAKALKSPKDNIEKESISFPTGGYYFLKGMDSQGSIRCTTYRQRPFQADMLSFDLWYKGNNILTDAGTFSYNTDENWMSYFNGTKSHNTIMVNNKDQMEKGSRFIWYKWIKAKTLKFNKTTDFTVFEGEHYGYSPYIHRRAIFNTEDVWVIIDDIIASKFYEEIKFNQQWLFGIKDVEFKKNNSSIGLGDLEMCFLNGNPQKNSLYFGDENQIRGWASSYYGEKEPVHQLVREFSVNKNTRLITVIKPKDKSVNLSSNTCINFQGKKIGLNQIGENEIIKYIY